MACCCKNCNAVRACADCATTPQEHLFGSVSGLTLQPSGVGFTNACDGNPANLTYSGGWADISTCIGQENSPFTGCQWSGATSPNFFSNVPSTFFTGWGRTTGIINGQLSLLLSGTTWTAEFTAQRFADSHELMLFRGTLVDPTQDCKNPSLTFTNACVIGACYTSLHFGFPAVGVATGGTLSISFAKSCCP